MIDIFSLSLAHSVFTVLLLLFLFTVFRSAPQLTESLDEVTNIYHCRSLLKGSSHEMFISLTIRFNGLWFLSPGQQIPEKKNW